MVWVSFVLMLVGLVGVVVGVRRRREGAGPCCRACDYDLTGIVGDAEIMGIVGDDGAAARCPECGGNLAASGAVVTGVRKERGRMAKATALIGLAMLVAGAGLGGYQAKRWSRSYDWNKAKPVWLLHAQAKKSTATSGVGVLDELIVRLEADRLSAAAAAPIIETLLTRQADLAAPWNQQWGDLMSAAFRDDLVTSDQERRYVAGVVVLESKTRPWIYPGEPVPIDYKIAEIRCGSKEKFSANFNLTEAHIGTKALEYHLFSGGTSIALAGWGTRPHLWALLAASGSAPYELPDHLWKRSDPRLAVMVGAPDEIGSTSLNLTWRVEISRTRQRPEEANDGDGDGGSGDTFVSYQTHTHTVEIVPPGTHDVAVRPGDDGLVVTAQEMRLERMDNTSALAHGSLGLPVLKQWSAYEVVWVLPVEVAQAWDVEREWIVGRYVFGPVYRGAASTLRYRSGRLELPAGLLDTERIDNVQVVLRPSAQAARMTTNITEIPAQPANAGVHRVMIVDRRQQ